jgi:hypothetical protein
VAEIRLKTNQRLPKYFCSLRLTRTEAARFIAPSGHSKENVTGRLEGKVAVVTGANSGIGLAGVKRFAREGARLFVMARRQAKLEMAVREFGVTTGVSGDVFKLADLDAQRLGALIAYGLIKRIDDKYFGTGSRGARVPSRLVRADFVEGLRGARCPSVQTGHLIF